MSSLPLCVDCDGTLVRTDLLHESTIALLRRKPWLLLWLPFWLLGGKAALKRQIAERASLEPALLPYNNDVLDFLLEERAKGRTIVLASASDRLLLEPVAKHLALFADTVASDGVVNMAGERKADRLEELYGLEGFDYLGNGDVDLPVWRKAAHAYVVGGSAALLGKIEQAGKPVVRAFEREKGLAGVIKSLRIHQWVKNLLLFLPAIMAQRLISREGGGDFELLSVLTLAFFAFCCCASAVYLINDLVDLDADRQHPLKKKRPLASGELPILWGVVLVPLLLLFAVLAALALPLPFALGLASYLIMTCAYSLVLKQIMMVDILFLACLYTLRVLCGGFAAEVEVSPWLLAFSVFFFFSLACTKRFSELYRFRFSSGEVAKTDGIAGRGYIASDLEPIAQFGSATGYISVLVLALYIHSGDVTLYYSRPEILWFICPLLLYWIGRLWLLAHRGQVHEDPIVFAIGDRVSYLVGVAGLAFFVGAM